MFLRVLRSVSLWGALKVTFDNTAGHLRVEGPGATEDTFEELLLALSSSLSWFGMVSSRERQILYEYVQ